MLPADSPFAPLPAPGPHPATAELRAYAAGTLAPADEHRIEAHLLDCERCAELAEGFSMTDAATTDRAVAELRTRLQARLGQEEPTPVAGGWAWPRIAAAAALLTAVAGGVWTWEQHGATPPPATARLETATPAAPPALRSAPAAAPVQSSDAQIAAEAEPALERPAADYAAVSPPSQLSRRPSLRAMSRSAQEADDLTNDQADLANMAAPPATPAAIEAETKTAASVASAPAAGSIAGYSSAPAVPKREGALPGRIAPDSVVPLGEVAMANGLMKAKAKMASAAPAVVANTPMPVAPTVGPAPVVGTIAFREYLRREASGFDPEINNLRLSGTVRLRFTVGADGKLNDLKVTRGLRADYDAEALRIVCDGPAWQPGIAAGKRAALPMEVTVPF